MLLIFVFFFWTRQIKSVKLIVINFHAIYSNSNSETIMRKWERAVLKFAVKSVLNNSLVKVYATSEGLMSDEVRRTGNFGFVFKRII